MGAALIHMCDKGLRLTKEGVEKYMDEVATALEQASNAKTAYQLYGTLCLQATRPRQ